MLGPPGAGKTTLLRTIVGLERPDEGDVYADGERITDVYPGDRDIAIMFQNLALYPDKTVYNNIHLKPLIDHALLGEAGAERMTEVIRNLRDVSTPTGVNSACPVEFRSSLRPFCLDRWAPVHGVIAS